MLGSESAGMLDEVRGAIGGASQQMGDSVGRSVGDSASGLAGQMDQSTEAMGGAKGIQEGKSKFGYNEDYKDIMKRDDTPISTEVSSEPNKETGALQSDPSQSGAQGIGDSGGPDDIDQSDDDDFGDYMRNRDPDE